MSIDQAKQNAIKAEAAKVIKRRLKSFPDESTAIRNAPFHKEFLRPFRKKLSGVSTTDEQLIALASWLHGLNTSLGQSFFEKVAHILSDTQKKSFSKPSITRSQSSDITSIISGLKNKTREPSIEEENRLLFSNINGERVDAANFTADVYFENDDSIYCIELKSVRINSGEGKGEKEKMLRGKAHLKLMNPDKEVRFFVGLPFDPTADSALEADKNRYFNYLVEFDKYFDPEEVLLGPELWSFLSGEDDGMLQVLDLISDAAQGIVD